MWTGGTARGSYRDLEGQPHHDDFDVSLVVCHQAAPFEEQTDTERHLLRLQFYLILTSQRELFPRLTADMRPLQEAAPHLPGPPRGGPGGGPGDTPGQGPPPLEEDRPPPEDTGPPRRSPRTSGRSWDGAPGAQDGGLPRASPPPRGAPPLGAPPRAGAGGGGGGGAGWGGRWRRRWPTAAGTTLWRRLLLGEDRLSLARLSLPELQELLGAVCSQSVGAVDPQLDCFLTLARPGTRVWSKSC
ncbi:KICSTOR complex protein SZT2-like [Menidia menidia]